MYNSVPPRPRAINGDRNQDNGCLCVRDRQQVQEGTYGVDTRLSKLAEPHTDNLQSAVSSLHFSENMQGGDREQVRKAIFQPTLHIHPTPLQME